MKTINSLFFIIVIIILSLFMVNCTKEDSLICEENNDLTFEENIPQELINLINANLESYEDYLVAGGISVNDLFSSLQIKKLALTRSSSSYGSCYSNFQGSGKNHSDWDALWQCIDAVDTVHTEFELAEPPEPSGPVESEPNVDSRYEKLEYFFKEGTDDYQTIKNIDYYDVQSIINARRILEREYPSVIYVAEKYYTSPNVFIYKDEYKDKCGHYIVKISSSPTDPNNKSIHTEKMNCSLDDYPLFLDNKCFDRMLDIAGSNRLNYFYSIGGWVAYPNRSYFLLKNIAEGKDAFPIVYIPSSLFFDEDSDSNSNTTSLHYPY